MSLFNKVASLTAYFEETLQTTAPVYSAAFQQKIENLQLAANKFTNSAAAAPFTLIAIVKLLFILILNF